MDQIGYLALCPEISVLTLQGNPLSLQLEGESMEHYQRFVKSCIPQLKVLDDQVFDGEDRASLQISRTSLHSPSLATSYQDLAKSLSPPAQQEEGRI